MKILSKLTLALSLSLLITVPAIGSAGDIAVIANERFPLDKVDLSYLKKVYLGKKKTEAGLKIAPLDYQDTYTVKKSFIKKVLSSTTRKYRAYWLKQIFREGSSPPKLVRNPKALLSAVRNTDGAIGYIDTDNLKTKEGIKVLHLIKLK